MSSEIPRFGQLEGVKMIAYQYIQQSKQKLVNRLAYLLLEHIVEQYQTNQYFRLVIAGSLSTAKQIIADAIQLYMQDKVQQKKKVHNFSDCASNKPEQTISKLQQNEQNAKLMLRINQLSKENQNLRASFQKERRKIHKLLQKYNCLSDMMFEAKQKSQNELKDLERSYQVKLQYANSKNQELRQQVIRLDVTLQFMMKSGAYIPPNLAKSPTQNTMSCQNYQENNKISEKSLTVNNVLSIQLPQTSKKLKLSLNQCSYRIQPQLIKEKSKISFNLIQSIPPITIQSIQTQTSMKFHLSFCKLQTLKVQRLSSNEVQIQASINQTSTETQTGQFQCQQLQRFKEQLRISNYLSQTFEKQSKKYKNDCILLSEQKAELVNISNHCIQENQRIRKQLNIQLQKLQLKVAGLNEHIQFLEKQKNDLLNLIQQFQANPSHSFTNAQDFKNTQNHHSQSEYTQESSTQPKKESLVFFQLNANQNTFEKASNLQGSIDEYIRKQTISRYFLQLLDQNCKGETQLILLNQIGECLGWNLKDYERLEFYRQKLRSKNTLIVIQEDQVRGKPNFKDKIYRFLTNQSETEE